MFYLFQVQANDTIDLWKNEVEENSRIAEVHRVQVINYDVTASGYDIHVKSWKKLYVPNWRRMQ